VIFDLDGTLTDPMDGFERSMNFALTHFGYEPVDTKNLAAFIGPPIEEAFKGITGKDEALEIKRAHCEVPERYNDVGYSENALPGMRALEDLERADVPMVVCTSSAGTSPKSSRAVRLRRHFLLCPAGRLDQLSQMRSRGWSVSLAAARETGFPMSDSGWRRAWSTSPRTERLKSPTVLWGSSMRLSRRTLIFLGAPLCRKDDRRPRRTQNESARRDRTARVLFGKVPGASRCSRHRHVRCAKSSRASATPR